MKTIFGWSLAILSLSLLLFIVSGLAYEAIKEFTGFTLKGFILLILGLLAPVATLMASNSMTRNRIPWIIIATATITVLLFTAVFLTPYIPEY